MTEVVVLCGPSGVGKSTLIDMLIKENENACEFVISHTTRPRRGKEKDGVEYYFVSKEVFHNYEYYEKVNFTDNYYGTSKQAIKKIAKGNKLPIMDVNIESIRQLKKQKDLIMTKVFIKPPSMMCLKERLEKRSKSTKETDESIRKRLLKAPDEISLLDEEHSEHILINDNLQETFSRLKKIVKPIIERLRKSRLSIESEDSKTAWVTKAKAVMELVPKCKNNLQDCLNTHQHHSCAQTQEKAESEESGESKNITEVALQLSTLKVKG